MKLSFLAFSMLVAIPAMSMAQTQSEQEPADEELGREDMDEIIEVRGGAYSMAEALSRKRESLQLVDAVVAEDIGKLPNNNLVEALQHVPGVQVGTRSSGETANLLVRGLGHVVTTINGRDAFTGAGRNFALQDIPATMVAGVDVFKSASADMVEGGIGGAIDVRTRRPFDFDGSQVSLTGKATYGDLSKKTDPNLSALLSNRWQTSVGDIGALINLSYIRTNYHDQIIWAGGAFPYDDAGTLLPHTPGESLDITDPSYNLVRNAIGGIDEYGERERPSVNLAFEWAPTANSLYYLEAFYSGYDNKRNAARIHFGTDSQPLLSPYEYYEGTNVVSRAHFANPHIMTTSNVMKDETDSYQYALGGEWNWNGNLEISSEITYQHSVYQSLWQVLDITHSVDEIIVDFNDQGSQQAGVEVIGGDLVTAEDAFFSYYLDGRHRAEGEGANWRLDLEYFRPLGFVQSWQFGTRYDIRSAKADNGEVGSCNDCENIQANDIDGLLSVTPGWFFRNQSSYPTQWATPSMDFMLDNKDLIREAFTDYVGPPPYNPLQFFDIEEESLALYGQTNLLFNLGGRTLDGLFGVRVVHTEGSLSGYETVESEAGSSEPVLRDHDSSSTEVLPNLTLRYQLAPEVQLRFNASRTLTRANFGDLNPVLTLNPAEGGQSGQNSAHGGNPDLRPVESNNFDLGAEYYWGERSAVYGTIFYRDIENWVQSVTENETIDGVDYLVTRPGNAGKGEMKGVELGIQYFPEAVPDWLQGIGMQGNYTYIEASTRDAEGNSEDMQGVSKHAASAVLIYERGPVSARLSHTYRDKHIAERNYSASMPPELYTQALNFTDFSLGYTVNENLVLTFDVTNIFGQDYHDYFGDPNLFNRDTRLYSTTYSLGFRFAI